MVLVAAGFAVSSCNTFIGMGRDIQSLGAGMQNTGHGKRWDGKQKQPVQQPGEETAVAPAE